MRLPYCRLSVWKEGVGGAKAEAAGGLGHEGSCVPCLVFTMFCFVFKAKTWLLNAFNLNNLTRYRF